MANINNTDIQKEILNFGEVFQLDPTLIAHCYHSYHYYHHHYHIHHHDIIIIILVNKKIKYLISYNVVIVYCSLFQEMKLVLHKLAEKMLPIALFLCFAALTVHSENSDIPRT